MARDSAIPAVNKNNYRHAARVALYNGINQSNIFIGSGNDTLSRPAYAQRERRLRETRKPRRYL